jgi:hypothetical protein
LHRSSDTNASRPERAPERIDFEKSLIATIRSFGTTRRSYLSGGTNSGASSPESLAKKLPNGAYADNHVGNLYIGPKYCRRGVISEEPQHAQIEAPDDDKN